MKFAAASATTNGINAPRAILIILVLASEHLSQKKTYCYA